MKELEALKLFEIEVNAIGWNDPRVEQFKEAIKILKQALTPPTQEEATEKAHKLTVQLLDKANQIIDEKEKELEVLKKICENGKKDFGLGLPTELNYLQYEEVDGARAVFKYLFEKLSKVGENK